MNSTSDGRGDGRLVSKPAWVDALEARVGVTAELVRALLWINILFSAVVGLYNAGVLQKRFIADALSASNAACGAFSIWFATQHKPEIWLF